MAVQCSTTSKHTQPRQPHRTYQLQLCEVLSVNLWARHRISVDLIPFLTLPVTRLAKTSQVLFPSFLYLESAKGSLIYRIRTFNVCWLLREDNYLCWSKPPASKAVHHAITMATQGGRLWLILLKSFCSSAVSCRCGRLTGSLTTLKHSRVSSFGVVMSWSRHLQQTILLIFFCRLFRCSKHTFKYSRQQILNSWTNAPASCFLNIP